jgi:LPS O-antigen subunit length determinant protein (WzzB/FepE family)
VLIRVQKEIKDQDIQVIGKQTMILPRRKSSCYSKDKIDEIKDNLTQQLEGQKSETRKERSRLIEKYDHQINKVKISLNELNSDLELTKQQ